MSSTILMAIVLVVMWLVVLVPMFVRRGDERAETRSMDRFATAMRVLSRRSPGTGVGRRPYATAPPTPYADGASPVRAAARSQMMRRRRRTLGVLAVTALLALPGAVLVSGWLWVLEAVSVLLLTGYVGWLRQQVRRESERRVRRAALFGEGTARPAAHHADHVARRPRAAGRAAPVAAAEAPAEQDRSWRPVPVPRPTYVTAPVVRRRPDSLVDLDDDDLSFADLDPIGDPMGREIDDDLDRPRAVNE